MDKNNLSYEEGYKEGYDLGLRFGWIIAQNIYYLIKGENNIFDEKFIADMFGTSDYDELFYIKVDKMIENIKRYRDYIEDHDFHVGDEIVNVCDFTYSKRIVTAVCDYSIHTIDNKGMPRTLSKAVAIKTGKHYEEMQKLLDSIYLQSDNNLDNSG